MPQTERCAATHGVDPRRDKSGHCSLCRRERKARERAERRALIQQIKHKRGCARCGGREALDFHHRDPTTKTHKVAYMVRWGTARLLSEVEKCDVLCRSCHMEHHFGRPGSTPPQANP